MDRQDMIGAMEMAQRLGVTTATVYNYIKDKRIPSTRVRRGLRFRVVVLRADFEAVVERLMSGEFDEPRKPKGQQNPSRVVALTN